jgi:acyl-CoA synthetase (AMP-forming)/AMP-acid ligase II
MAEKFDPAGLPESAHSHAPDMRRERTAYIFMVPTMLNTINRIPGIERKAHEIFGDAMYQGYGQTEVLPVAMMAPRQ